jgi:outer membrane protein OmpA-like peptidoglycan-associated protein
LKYRDINFKNSTMKTLKTVVIALFVFALTGNVNAQDGNNPWVVGFGINAVDFNTTSDFKTQFEDFTDIKDWNTIPSISRISVDKYLEKGFTLQIAGALNKIETLMVEGDSDFLYYAFDANVKYDLNTLVGETAWFDPYVFIGGGYVAVDDQGEGMFNVGLGFNTWFNDKLGLNFQTGVKKGFSQNVATHVQHSVGLVIKFGGTDTDGDGVYDKFDACPEVVGLEQFNGCPDADGDGVKDSDDACPEVVGLVAMNGCPDADGDGIADKDDMCPDEKGTKANKGCPDTDGDGTFDKDDKCSDVAGPTANAGCPWPDTDGDSILDKDDKCPAVAGIASEGGCPEVITNEAKMGMDTFAEAILFTLESANFQRGVRRDLDGMLAIIKEFPQANFAIRGYTDVSGSVSGNLKLSNSRANAVKDYLVKNGIDAARLTVAGFGQESPTASNKTRAGRIQNRRVEVKVTN